MDTNIKTTIYAKKLRDRLKDLTTQHEKDMKVYAAALESWRKALVLWLVTNASPHTKDIDAIELCQYRVRYWDDRPGFDARKFFVGAPMPPKRPDDKQVSDIRSMLRYLSITGQATIRVSTEDVTKFLGDKEDQEAE